MAERERLARQTGNAGDPPGNIFAMKRLSLGCARGQ